MDYVSQMILPIIKKGDIIEIEPIPKFPNCERKITVDDITDKGFLYGCSTTCDGYMIPFYFINSLKIIGHKEV